MLPRFQLGEIRHSAMTDQLKPRRGEMSKRNGIGLVGVSGTPEVREDLQFLWRDIAYTMFLYSFLVHNLTTTHPQKHTTSAVV